MSTVCVDNFVGNIAFAGQSPFESSIALVCLFFRQLNIALKIINLHSFAKFATMQRTLDKPICPRSKTVHNLAHTAVGSLQDCLVNG
jgi:hypothetical protein